MSEIHYISRVEYCEVRELTAMTVVKKQFALVPPAANFTRLPMVGLASVEVSDKIENKQRVFVSKLAVFLPERFEVGNKKLYDPRSWGREAESAMAARVVEACKQLGSAGRALN